MSDIKDFIRRLPKAELHLHLEGTILPSTLVELSTRNDAIPMKLREAKSHYRFDDFTSFIEGFKAVTRRLINPEDYELTAWRMMQHLAKQGVVHAEVYISVGVIYLWRNFDPGALEPIFAALERARERGERELGLSLYWIFDAVRHFTIEEAERVFRKAAEMRPHYPSIIGIGLGADSAVPAQDPSARITPGLVKPVCGSPTTPAKPPAPTPSGRRSQSDRSGSGTLSRQSRTPLSLRNLERATSRWS